jgi:hypothetical protein
VDAVQRKSLPQPGSVDNGEESVESPTNGVVTNFCGKRIKHSSTVCAFEDDIVLEAAAVLRPHWEPVNSPATTGYRLHPKGDHR